MGKVEKLTELADQLKFPDYNGFPDIELYMDQVLDFLTRSKTSLRDDDRLSSAMVNNYIKADVLPRARGKKYSREHLILISLIYQLKGALSINDIKITLDGVNEKIISENFQLETFYNNYLKLITKNVENFKESIKKQSEVASNFKAKENLETVLWFAVDGGIIHLKIARVDYGTDRGSDGKTYRARDLVAAGHELHGRRRRFTSKPLIGDEEESGRNR
jgi:hypothetical protein